MSRTFDRVPELDPRNRDYPIMALIEQREPRARGWSLKTQLDQGSEGACLPAGTLVRMADGSHRPIEEIRLLDEVITAEGRTGTVEQMMVRWHDDGLFAIRLRGLASVRMTAEHPVLTQRGYVPANELKIGDYAAVTRHQINQRSQVHTGQWVSRRTPSRALQVGSRRYQDRFGGVTTCEVATTIPEVLELTEPLGRLFGLYLAEGCLTEERVVWTFGRHECDTLVAETIGLVGDLLGAEARLQVRGNGTHNVVLYGKRWRELFGGLFGTGAGIKSLGALATGPESFLRGILGGWIAGDGYRRRHSAQAVTVSRRLAYDMHGVGQALGLRPTLRHSVGVATGNVRSRRDRYDLEIAEGEGQNVPEQDANATWRKVVSITEEPWLGSVYNLHVSDDNSYVADGLGVHNCVGFAWSHELAAIPKNALRFVSAPPDDYARQIYRRAQQLDPWEGESYEGTSVLAGAKAVMEQGHMAEYRWAFGLNEVLLAISYAGPVVLGLNWYGGMMDTNSVGYIHPTGSVMGGHAIVAIAVHTATQRVVLQNSWGSGWGTNGRCFLTWDELGFLLHSEDGECCVPVGRR